MFVCKNHTSEFWSDGHEVEFHPKKIAGIAASAVTSCAIIVIEA